MSQDQSQTQHVSPSHTGVAGSRLTLLLSALVGGALTWLLLWGIYPIFAIPEELAAQAFGKRDLPPELTAALMVAARTVDLQHAMVVTGIFGALLASLLACGEGLARRSLWTVVFGTVLGVVVGGGVGCLAGLLGFLVDDHLTSVEGVTTLTRSVCAQGVMLAGLGAAVGLAFGLLTRRASAALTCLAYGLLGGGLAAMLFPIGVALVVPNLDPEPTIPSHEMIRLAWIATVSGLLGLLIPEALRPRAPRRVSDKSTGA
ncbi:MAG: hypothetical protein ACYC3X_31495 [Pirellulaceae bacterium]